MLWSRGRFFAQRLRSLICRSSPPWILVDPRPRSPIHFTSMRGTFDTNKSNFVLDRIDHAVSADPNAPKICAAHHFLASRRPRYFLQTIKCNENTISYSNWKAQDLTLSAPEDPYFVAHFFGDFFERAFNSASVIEGSFFRASHMITSKSSSTDSGSFTIVATSNCTYRLLPLTSYRISTPFICIAKDSCSAPPTGHLQLNTVHEHSFHP